jgi:translation initiation factor 2 subunit 2
MKSYKELLERAQQKLPRERGSGERFEIPKIRLFVVGRTRSIINNFKEISDALNRDPRHLLKFLTNEMATAATLEETRATFQGKFTKETLDRLLNTYIENFVICPVCKRPDTKITKEKRFFFLVCEACGAKSSAKSV